MFFQIQDKLHLQEKYTNNTQPVLGAKCSNTNREQVGCIFSLEKWDDSKIINGLTKI